MLDDKSFIVPITAKLFRMILLILTPNVMKAMVDGVSKCLKTQTSVKYPIQNHLFLGKHAVSEPVIDAIVALNLNSCDR